MAANPCPCGNAGGAHGQPCECSASTVRRYLGRMSGPLLDRMDIRVLVPRVTTGRMRDADSSTPTTAVARAAVAAARARMAERLHGTGWSRNAEVTGAWLRADPTGERDPSFRGTESARNALFADFMFGTALRLTEQASLLLKEIPAPDSARVYFKMRVPAAIAKNESERDVYVAERLLRAVALYVESDRAAAVKHARRTGAYDSLANKITVDDDGAYRNASGFRISTDQAAPEERLLMFRRTNEGLEPAALWLTRTGLPMRSRSWQGIFKAANLRAERLSVDLRCNAHKLRHSWATITLAQLQRRYNRYRDEAPHSTSIGDPLNWVSRRLGHRWVETTMIYIHNLNELEAETILTLIPNSVDLVALPTRDGASLDALGLRLG
ncbi:ATP-binding protein [Curtobacterium flaccumfaciens]|uniref:ATP-binding protein n=1 Tax=Curtobacterium flaccumfaciens TaxID=2035 RepID=UPI0020327DCF|nr:ATP-binding protein [Curtobacterium flaccumfaciens]MCX2844163.1 ATP-binding protein [Curtobacterium flaccumfaciens pv. oortii]